MVRLFLVLACAAALLGCTTSAQRTVAGGGPLTAMPALPAGARTATISELRAHPARYLDEMVLVESVEAAFVAVPACTPLIGPVATAVVWSPGFSHEGLPVTIRTGATPESFGTLRRATFTVVGRFRRYVGPIGCESRRPDGSPTPPDTTTDMLYLDLVLAHELTPVPGRGRPPPPAIGTGTSSPWDEMRVGTRSVGGGAATSAAGHG